MKANKDTKNFALTSYCPICGHVMMWLPIEPIHPDADYTAFCPQCVKRFDLSVVPKDNK